MKYDIWVTKFRVDRKTKEDLTIRADLEGCSETDILRRALLEYLRRVRQ